MRLDQLKPHSSHSQRRVRVGRGNGSKRGNYSCRGIKGQSARTGSKRPPGFEGGQTPLYRKMPKLKGFRNINQRHYQIINVSDLNIFENNSEITSAQIFEKGLIAKSTGLIKILGSGEITKKLIVKIPALSKSASAKIVAAGGSVEKI